MERSISVGRSGSAWWHLLWLALFSVVATGSAQGQGTGQVQGTVTLAGAGADSGTPMHGVTVRILGQSNKEIITEEGGKYSFSGVPAGDYTVVAHMDGMRDATTTVAVRVGETATADFALRLLGPRESVTVTASGREEVASESFKVVTTLDSVDIAEKANTNIGEVLEHEPGVAKRSFGSGISRPVIRGFDGDRVLIVQDGARTGSLSSQSGDHAEPIDPLSLESLEVVKGPSTLLYGSNALGGVVNAMTGHNHAHPGVRGYLTGVGGTANEHGGGSAGFEFGHNSWLLWGGGGGQRTGNYHTPIGEIFNSDSRILNGNAGVGWFGNRTDFSLGYDTEKADYGIPIGTTPEEDVPENEELVDITMRRHSVPLRLSFHDMDSWINSAHVSLNYTDYHHEEINRGDVDTVFDNKQFVYRSSFEQRQSGALSGTLGFEGWRRDYKTTGEEAIAPPVIANAFALFGLEQIDLQKVRFQFGGRYENTRYDPEEMDKVSFNGFSGSAGIQVPLWEGGNFLASYTHSSRSPALEELFNNGPHGGNLTFEIGDPNLNLERADGIELSLRQTSSRLRGEANFYYYNMGNFVYLAPTGEVEDGLNVAEYSQADSRFIGGEFGLDLGLHQDFWVKLGLDAVSAQLKDSGTPLPRIPPMRGRVGFEARLKELRINPEMVFSDAQNEVFTTETRTAGYAVANLNVSYTIAQQHSVHIFSANFFNMGDRFYQNHLSLIKDFAPESGRGIRFSYAMRFF